ncbi:MAG TPA: glycoside hydrolase family 127 protein [Candidatus Hydrogenedens sp.]|nr:glycoside hydrolase family 127 protein [Candidatus Hydrogenedens sp.]
MLERIVLLVGFLFLFNSFALADNTSFFPKGELEKRILWVQDRFDFVHDPAFTDSFILQDVRLDPNCPRRFQEFSGDISGRFLEAISVEPRGEYYKIWADRIAHGIIKYQREDGRFGYPELIFTKDKVGREHMALLWGNGRLLVGLISYYQTKNEPAILDACKKMGDFFIKIFDECSQPEVIQRLVNQGANGFICFTQWSEGLELLARASGDMKYRETAKKMEPLLQPPQKQHSHGYITTLRGDMLIWETTHDTDILARNEKRFAQLVEEGWIQTNGGVAEYFDKTYPRDEGCSEADFLRWCLQLFKATGKETYLEYAERCLFNSLLPNQFETGDFGHHTFDGWGYISAPGPGRAWWCCTMHGLRAMHDLKQSVISCPESGKMQINFLLSGEYYTDNLAIKTHRIGGQNGSFDYQINWLTAPENEWTLIVRHPTWAETIDVVINDKPEMTSSNPGVIQIKRVWVEGDKVLLKVQPKIRILNAEQKEIPFDQLSNQQKVAVFIGPWLVGVNAMENPMFHGEPYSDNIILLPKTLQELRQKIYFGDEVRSPLQSGPRLTLPYRHSGFSELCHVTLTPISERSRNIEVTHSFWFIAKVE